jgi:subtilase family serine protease
MALDLNKKRREFSMQSSHRVFLAALAAGTALSSQALAATLSKAPAVQPAAANAPVSFEVYLPLRDRAGLEALIRAQHTPGSPQYHHWLTPSQFKARFGPSQDSVARVKGALGGMGLRVSATHTRSLRVAGDAFHAGALLHTSLNSVRSANGKTRLMATTNPVLPAALRQEGAMVVAFSGLPDRRTFSKKNGKAAHAIPSNRYGVAGPYWFDDLKQAYDYPSYTPPSGQPVLDGTGVSVAVLMADLIFPNDVAAAFNHEKFTAITGKPVPTVTTVKIDGGGVYDGYGSFEASLDVQQVLGGAPGANVTLVSIPDLSDQSIIDGYSYIVDSNQYDIVNSSFGGCENVYTRQYNKGTDFTYILQIEDEIYLQGNAQGITFVASSGDEGALECPTPDYLYGGNHAVFVKGASSPADDPNVTAVGGGNLITGQTAGSLDSPYVRESAYGDPEAPYDIYGLGVNVAKGIWGAGGGVSAIFGRPAYQALVKTNSPAWRTLPDVGMQVGGLGFSGVACEAITCGADDSSVLTAYGVGLGGGYYYTIGTSVSSPEFVGALALYEQGAHRQGNVNTYLYQAAAAQNAAGGASAPADKQYFHRNIPGYDGAYTGGQPNANYNYIYGNGSPDVRKLFGLTGYAPAGTPQTAGNP